MSEDWRSEQPVIQDVAAMGRRFFDYAVGVLLRDGALIWPKPGERLEIGEVVALVAALESQGSLSKVGQLAANVVFAAEYSMVQLEGVAWDLRDEQLSPVDEIGLLASSWFHLGLLFERLRAATNTDDPLFEMPTIQGKGADARNRLRRRWRQRFDDWVLARAQSWADAPAPDTRKGWSAAGLADAVTRDWAPMPDNWALQAGEEHWQPDQEPTNNMIGETIRSALRTGSLVCSNPGNALTR